LDRPKPEGGSPARRVEWDQLCASHAQIDRGSFFLQSHWGDGTIEINLRCKSESVLSADRAVDTEQARMLDRRESAACRALSILSRFPAARCDGCIIDACMMEIQEVQPFGDRAMHGPGLMSNLVKNPVKSQESRVKSQDSNPPKGPVQCPGQSSGRADWHGRRVAQLILFRG
jgi:hypothetical protein